MATNYPVNPRVRAFGKARIDIAGRAKNQAEWEKLWKHPANSFPFIWGESWKQCVEYRVDDFPAEVGFFIDVLGLPVNAFDPGYAMFTSPKGDFFFSVIPAPPAEQSTPPDAFRLQFMVKDIMAITHELQRRGIDFEQPPQPLSPGSSLFIGYFRTPHGICVELWGTVDVSSSSDVKVGWVENRVDREEGHEIDDEPSVLNEEEGESDEDSDDDLVEYEDDDDKDNDDFDGDEEVTALNSGPRKSFAPNSRTLPMEVKSKLPDNNNGVQNEQDPEYIDLDTT